jgi:hypothetical protein
MNIIELILVNKSNRKYLQVFRRKNVKALSAARKSASKKTKDSKTTEISNLADLFLKRPKAK